MLLESRAKLEVPKLRYLLVFQRSIVSGSLDEASTLLQIWLRIDDALRVHTIKSMYYPQGTTCTIMPSPKVMEGRVHGVQQLFENTRNLDIEHRNEIISF